MKVTEQQVVFAVGRGDDGVPMLVVGVPAGAWDYMREGKTHHFDLSPVGVPLKLMLFGAADHAEAMATLTEAARQSSTALLDERRRDWSIKPGKSS